MRKIFTLLLPLALMLSCSDTDPYWSQRSSWYNNGQIVNDGFVDVLYFTSTDVQNSCDTLGNECFRAVLNDNERYEIQREIEFVNAKIFCDSVNFFSPFYHQFTIDAIWLPEDEFAAIRAEVEDECWSAFKYYMANMNNGRPYILAGFSQGAMQVVSLLKKMNRKQYSGLVAAYVIGLGINDDDLACDYIKPARSSDDRGVCVSFNSVADTSAVWPAVYNNASVCINPVNWRTDSTVAEFEYKGDMMSVSVDTEKNVLVVSDIDTSKYENSMLHHYDLLFYTDCLKKNALKRAYAGK